jgi:hypothetical protein
MGWTDRGSIPGRDERAFLLQNVHTVSGAHTASVQWVWSYFPGLKQRERQGNHSFPSSDEDKNQWSYTSTSHICLCDVDKGHFTAVLYFQQIQDCSSQ